MDGLVNKRIHLFTYAFFNEDINGNNNNMNDGDRNCDIERWLMRGIAVSFLSPNTTSWLGSINESIEAQHWNFWLIVALNRGDRVESSFEAYTKHPFA